MENNQKFGKKSKIWKKIENLEKIQIINSSLLLCSCSPQLCNVFPNKDLGYARLIFLSYDDLLDFFMSDRPRRVQSRLDYNIYNITGKKVAKENRTLERLSEGFEKLAVMATEKLEVEEKKINRKIIRFLKENDEFTSFFDVDDIEKAVVEIKWLLEKYEETHLELEEELGDDQYKKKYENLQVPQLASTWVKNAKLEIKRRKEARNKLIEDEKLESLLREKEKLRTEVRHATTRIDQDLKIMFEDNSEFVEDLNRNINVVRGYIHEYSNVIIKVENLFTVEEYNLEFYSTYINKNTLMNDFIREMFEKIKIIKHNEIEIQKQKEETTRKSEIELRTDSTNDFHLTECYYTFSGRLHVK